MQSPCVMTEDYDFHVLMGYGISSFLLPITSNKGSIRVKFNFVLFTPKMKKCQFPCMFAQKLRFSSPHKVIKLSSFLLLVTSNKGQILFCPIFLPKIVNSHLFLRKNYDFRVFIKLLNVLLPVTSNKGWVRVKLHFVRFSPKKCQFSYVFA